MATWRQILEDINIGSCEESVGLLVMAVNVRVVTVNDELEVLGSCLCFFVVKPV
jgi:hypothetical protein